MYHYDHQSISFLILSILMLYIVELFKKKLFFFFKIKLADISASAGAVWIPYPPCPTNQKKFFLLFSKPITGDLSFTKVLNPDHLCSILLNSNNVDFLIRSIPIAISKSSGKQSWG